MALRHETTYTFARPVTISPHTIRLRPAAHSRTPISAYALTVTPEVHFLNWQQDPFGNYLARVVFPEPASELIVVVDLVADMTVSTRSTSSSRSTPNATRSPTRRTWSATSSRTFTASPQSQAPPRRTQSTPGSTRSSLR